MLSVIAIIGLVAAVIGIGLYLNFKKVEPMNTEDCKVLERKVLPGGEVLEIVNDGCQEGLPHTSGPNTIRMTRSVYGSSDRDSILTHERVHLNQKTRPDAWLQFVKSAWSYELTNQNPGVPTDIYELRPNPDTNTNPYSVWRGRYVFFSAFDASRKLSAAPVIVWDLEERKALSGPPSEWKAQFCTANGKCPHQYEHPYEIAAEYATHQMETPASAQLSTFLSQ
jgi:hypothetical protein